jgi:hypothetical protein
MTEEFRVAVVQAAPVFFDCEKSADKACTSLRPPPTRAPSLLRSARRGYPGIRCSRRTPESTPQSRISTSTRRTRSTFRDPATDALGDAARRAGIDVVIGVVERDQHAQLLGTQHGVAPQCSTRSDVRSASSYRRTPSSRTERRASRDRTGDLSPPRTPRPDGFRRARSAVLCG